MSDESRCYVTIPTTDAEVPMLRAYAGVPTLKDLQEAVGGYIEAVDLHGSIETRRISLYAHEEALLQNPIPAPSVYLPQRGEPIFGPVAIAAVEPDGETDGLTPAEVMALRYGKQSAIWQLRSGGAMLIPVLEYDPVSAD